MKLNSLQYFPYTLLFNSAFITANVKLESRKIYILRMRDEHGKFFYGEAAPLPQFGSEEFGDIAEELKRLSSISSFYFPDGLSNLFEYIESLKTFPTIQYAFEHIFLQKLISADNKLVTLEYDNKNINVNALLDIRYSKREIKELIAKGFTTFKLKAGKENFDELYDYISWAETEFQSKIKFRLDPNCSWTVNETLRRAERLEKFRIEYIEQPVKEKDNLLKVADLSPIPIAADESIRNLMDAQDLVSISNIKFMVVKPMFFGGLRNILKFKKMLEGKDIKIIVSSSLESNVGKRHLALIAANINNNLSHGLGTSELFSNQPIDDVFKINKGEIKFSYQKYIDNMEITLK